MTNLSTPSLRMVLVLALGLFALMFRDPSSLQATEALQTLAPSPCLATLLSVVPDDDLVAQDDQDDEDNNISCTGDEVAATISEDEGLITIKACVTNGSCTGTWGGADIEITGTGRLCVTLTFSPE